MVDSLDGRSSGDKTQHSTTRFAPKDDDSADTSDTWIWCWICWSTPHKLAKPPSIYSIITFLTCNVYLGFEILKQIFLPVVDTEGCHLNAVAETRATFEFNDDSLNSLISTVDLWTKLNDCTHLLNHWWPQCPTFCCSEKLQNQIQFQTCAHTCINNLRKVKIMRKDFGPGGLAIWTSLLNHRLKWSRSL